jgi:hypothetical protein
MNGCTFVAGVIAIGLEVAEVLKIELTFFAVFGCRLPVQGR